MTTGLSFDERRSVLSQHQDLRALLFVVEDAAKRVRAFEPGAISSLRDAIRDLDVAFRAHLAFEESILVPILPPHALSRLQTEHSEQRTMLEALSNDVDRDTKEPTALADDAVWLIESLRRDMRIEDRAIDMGTIEGGA